MSTNPDDNIADETAPTSAAADDLVADEYMKKFDIIDDRIQVGSNYLRPIAIQPDQDHRIALLIKFAENQQKLNEDMYDLLVRMNNFFAPK